jgi:transposase
MKAYSQDLREKVVQAIEQGKTRKEVVDVFGVSLSTVKRYIRQKKQIGHIQPKKIPGRPSVKGALLQNKILAQLEAHPDATLQEHCDLWEQESGIKVGIMTMSRAIERVRWKRKKLVRSKRSK